MSKLLPHIQLFLILSFISLVVFGLDNFNLLSLPKQGLYFITNPVAFGFYGVKQKVFNQFYFMFASRTAAKANKALQSQFAEILSENAQLKKQLAETKAQVIQQQSLDPQTYHYIVARPMGLDRQMRIDKGAKDGVKVGQAVVFKDNYIGRIVSVSDSGSSIQLLTDPDSKVAAFSLNKEGKAKGIVVGQFGFEMLIDKILHEEKVVAGDLVYSEGTEGYLPRGFVLGKVTQILERPNEVFKQAKLTPVFDLRDLDLVFVVQE